MAGDPVLYGPQFVFIQGNLLPQPEQVRLGLDTLCLAGLLGYVEVTAGASHPMRALVEEVVGAIAVTEIVELPRLIRRASASNYLMIELGRLYLQIKCDVKTAN